MLSEHSQAILLEHHTKQTTPDLMLVFLPTVSLILNLLYLCVYLNFCCMLFQKKCCLYRPI